MTCPAHKHSSLFCCTEHLSLFLLDPLGCPLPLTMPEWCRSVQLYNYLPFPWRLFVCFAFSRFVGEFLLMEGGGCWNFFYFACVVSHIKPSLFFSLLPLLPVLSLKALQCKPDIRKKSAGIVEGSSKWTGWLRMALHVFLAFRKNAAVIQALV